MAGSARRCVHTHLAAATGSQMLSLPLPGHSSNPECSACSQRISERERLPGTKQLSIARGRKGDTPLSTRRQAPCAQVNLSTAASPRRPRSSTCKPTSQPTAQTRLSPRSLLARAAPDSRLVVKPLAIDISRHTRLSATRCPPRLPAVFSGLVVIFRKVFVRLSETCFCDPYHTPTHTL